MKNWRLKTATTVWIVTAAAVLAVLLASLKGYSIWFQGQNVFTPGPDPTSGFKILSAVISLANALICLFLSLVLFWQKRQEPMALFVSFYVLAYGILFAGPFENPKPLFPGAFSLSIQGF